LSSLFSLFVDNIFPIIAVAAIGFTLQRRFSLDPRPLSIMIFNVLTPALIFQLTAQNTAKGTDSLRMVGLVVGLVLVLTVISFGISRRLKLSPVGASAFFLSVAFMNAGNYGLSLNQFALGQEGLVWASLFYITHVMLMNSLGVFLASSGKMRIQDAIRGLLRVPALYSFSLAMIFRLTGTIVPSAIIKPIELLSAATIPAMLLVLGMQIGRAGLPKNIGLVSLASSVRLILSPALAWIFTRVMGLPSLGSQAGILEAGMPSPVLAIIISLEYDTDPGFVSSVVLLSTILSPITLTLLLGLLGL
jgi:predicted permease